MIKCPQCGEQNQVGAIFCRGCGNRLELDELKPDDFKKGGEDTIMKTALVILKNLITLAILVVLALTVVSIFLKPPIRSFDELTLEETNVALKKFKRLRKGKPGSLHSFRLNEVNMLAMVLLDLTEEGKIKTREKRIESGEIVAFIPDEFYIDFTPPNNMKFVLKSRVYDKINLYSTLTGTLVASNSGLNFTTSKAYIGKLPLPFSFLKEPVIDLFKPLLDHNEKFKSDIQSQISQVDLEFDRISLKKKYKKKRK